MTPAQYGGKVSLSDRGGALRSPVEWLLAPPARRKDRGYAIPLHSPVDRTSSKAKVMSSPRSHTLAKSAHMSRSNLVIIGGGFAGTTLAQHLERRLAKEWKITLISRENCITFVPLLAEVVGASILPGHAVAPIRQMLKRSRYVMATVADIDFDKREIHCSGRPTSV